MVLLQSLERPAWLSQHDAKQPPQHVLVPRDPVFFSPERQKSAASPILSPMQLQSPSPLCGVTADAVVMADENSLGPQPAMAAAKTWFD